MNINVKAAAKLARSLRLSLDAMEAYFVLLSFSRGRQQFEANEEDLAKHFYQMIKSGLIQEMYRATINDTNDDDWRSQVEAYIAEIEAELSANN